MQFHQHLSYIVDTFNKRSLKWCIVTVQPLRPRGVFCERRSQKTRVFQARNYAECIISVHNRCYEAVRLNSNGASIQ
jgi:hypothetical protein